jgi:phosphoribosylanthranilate isomerase
MKLKVCGITQQHQADELAALHVDYVGFIFYSKSKRYVTNTILTSSNTTRCVGVFVNTNYDEIKNELRKVPSVETLQLHGTESVALCKALKNEFTVIKAISVSDESDLDALTKPYIDAVDYFLFDTKTIEYGGSGKRFNWSALESYHQAIPFFLSGGVAPDTIEVLKKLNHPQLFAVDINSKFEESPGIKNISLISDFIKKLP